MVDLLVTDIIKACSSGQSEVLIQEFTFQASPQNELLFFFKPGCFNVPNITYTQAIVEMVLAKFQQYDVSIAGALLLSGTRLEELEIMDRHYGFINKLSKQASTILTEQDRQKIRDGLSISTNFNGYRIFGGHEFLQQFPQYDVQRLTNLWASKRSVKLRSGFYVQQYEVDRQSIILINGFHPSQLAVFTNPAHKIALLLLHSETDWHALKYDLAGDTFPEKAQPDSIRGELFAHHDSYGAKEISIANNMVHLSAGPFEALFEIYNFLHDIPVANFALNATNMARLMKDKGLSEEDVAKCLSNPTAQINESKVDLFTYTEDKDSEAAIGDYIAYFRN